MSSKLKFLFIFAQAHPDFRIPELLSVAELNGFAITIPPNVDPNCPFLVLELAGEHQAIALAQRCILIKSIYEFYAQGTSYDELHTHNKLSEPLWSKYVEKTSFRFLISGYNQSIPQNRQTDVMESFDYMDFKGKIDMKSPEIQLGCFEEYEDHRGRPQELRPRDGEFKQVYFGRLIKDGAARSLITHFDVKKRVYHGNTSMEAEMSLLMANQALAGPGKLIYDPFVGTGSMVYTIAHFGALLFGSDIDGRQMRGKQKVPGIIRASTQYGVAPRVLDLMTFDVTQNPWRCAELFDAIVTDPPYGVRAGAKRLGRKKEADERQKVAYGEHRANPRPDDQPYIPPTKPYELSHLATDLVLLSRYLLKPNGRLVFFLPTVSDEYQEVDIKEMLCEGVEVVGNSEQGFGSWGRRLVTIKKVTTKRFERPEFREAGAARESGEEHVPAHRDFREKYFQGFKKESLQENKQT